MGGGTQIAIEQNVSSNDLPFQHIKGFESMAEALERTSSIVLGGIGTPTWRVARLASVAMACLAEGIEGSN